MANPENLTPWKAGQSGNPLGKAKGTKNRSTILKQFLSLKAAHIECSSIEDLPDGLTVEEAMHLAILDKALKGDLAAFKEIQDTLYGKIKQTAQVNHSFKTMGQVLISQDTEDKSEKIMTALTFDVGQTV